MSKGERKAIVARRKTDPNDRSEHDPGNPPAAEIDLIGSGVGVQTTGRFIVVFKDEAVANTQAIQSTLNNVAGLRAGPVSADYEGGAIAAADLDAGEVVRFSQLGIAVVSGEEA